jgi:TM2 domain-containing membrane protein YozV
MNCYCKKTHGIPALFSFFIPGLGQLVKGDLFKALGIWIAFIITGIMHIFGAGFLIWLIIWVWQIYDAYNA